MIEVWNKRGHVSRLIPTLIELSLVNVFSNINVIP